MFKHLEKKNNLKKGIITIFVSNIINLFFKIFIYFFQPKFLSLNTYAMIQTFTLYFSYAGLFHFGYIDGMYLNLGGQNISKIKKEYLLKDAATLRGLQTFVLIAILFVAFLLKNEILFYVSIAVFPGNLSAYFRMLFQATGQFDKYGKIININTFFLFAYNFILLFVLHSDFYVFFILCEIAINIIMWIILEINFYKMIDKKISMPLYIHISHLKKNIKDGLPLTLGNLSANFFSSLDRWFVKFLLTTNDFAYYSFAVSIESFLNIAITPVTITLYNYFCQNNDEDELNRIKNFVIILAVFLVSLVFPAKFILEHFIGSYINSLEVLFVLFGAKIFSIIIQGIYVNMYKANKMQTIYLYKLIFCIGVGAVFNSFAYILTKSNIGFAIATLLTVLIWFFLCKQDFNEILFQKKEIIFLIAMSAMLIVCGEVLNAVVGFGFYLTIAVIGVKVLFPNEIRFLLKQLFDG